MQHTFNPKIRSLLLLFVVCLFSFPVFAQEENVAKEDSSIFRFTVDYNRFRYADSLTYLEYTLSLFQNVLQYQPDQNGGFVAQFLVTSELYGMDQDTAIAKSKWINENHIDSLGKITPNQRLFTLNHFAVQPGKYLLNVTVQDINQQNSIDRVRIPVEAIKFSTTELAASDLQLSSHIERDNSDNPFVKNGYRIMPNPTFLYGIGLPILYCYSEVYNLAPATSDSGKIYTVDYIITDRDNREQKRYQVKHQKPGDSAVEVYKINVVTLFSGPYYLTMLVTDLENGNTVTRRNKFYVYREDDFNDEGELIAQAQNSNVVQVGSPGLDAHRYDVMTEKEIDQEFQYTKYIAKKAESDTYNKLTLDGKRNFIKTFWAERDETPGTPVNEYKKGYLDRVNRANKEFRGGFKDGWKTDRGRVLLLYGNPDEIERFSFTSQSRPYEIWHYPRIEGGVFFVFVDRKNMGDYELVHSTARGELYDEDWERWLSPDPETQQNYNIY